MISTLPKAALEVIDAYRHLPIAGKLVACPYVKNRLGVRFGYRVKLGKGSPTEIAEEVELIARERKLDLKQLDNVQIRKFMREQGLGVDCSGFIVWILWAIDPVMVREIAAKSWVNPYRAWMTRMRPLENLAIRHLTSAAKADQVADFREVRPGDIIRTWAGKHGLIVTRVSKSESGKLKEINYAHSTGYYGVNNGVRSGQIKIIYPQEKLKDQDWKEPDNRARNYTLEGLSEDDGLNGIYRLKLKIQS